MLERLCQLEALEAFASVHLVLGTDHHNRKKLCPSLKFKFCTVYQITSRLLYLKDHSIRARRARCIDHFASFYFAPHRIERHVQRKRYRRREGAQKSVSEDRVCRIKIIGLT